MIEQLKKCLILTISIATIFCGCGRKTTDSITVAGSTAFRPGKGRIFSIFLLNRNDIDVALAPQTKTIPK